MKRLRILIIDDHRLVRDGIKTMLETQSANYDFDISEAENGETAIEIIKNRDFDIILVDYQLPKMNGAQTVEQILFYKPKSKILALSNYDEYTYITNMIKVGVKGYVLKNISPNELIKAIETILLGKKYYASDVSGKIIDSEEKREQEKRNAKIRITRRQSEVLKLVATGMTNDAIAKQLSLSKRTVDTHRQNLLLKLNVHNTAALIKKATELAML
ncbi:MAG: response regulator transcription factor [Bacteroidia bacterium]|nr:response regulator transcription factor [Bacteroidia bacterium]